MIEINTDMDMEMLRVKVHGDVILEGKMDELDLGNSIVTLLSALKIPCAQTSYYYGGE